MIVCGAQFPCALACSIFVHRRGLASEKDRLDEPVEAPSPASVAAPPLAAADARTISDTRTIVPDHELLRCVGEGAYGEVWLARNAVGIYHAVKLVRRNKF